MDKFTELMVKDVKTGDCFRADHLLEDRLEKLLEKEKDANKRRELEVVLSNVDGMSPQILHEALQKYDVKAPETGHDISEPFPFNLMFGTQIGPTGKFPGYLRPETAQGIFVNFKRLLEYNGGRLPFAAVCTVVDRVVMNSLFS